MSIINLKSTARCFKRLSQMHPNGANGVYTDNARDCTLNFERNNNKLSLVGDLRTSFVLSWCSNRKYSKTS